MTLADVRVTRVAHTFPTSSNKFQQVRVWDMNCRHRAAHAGNLMFVGTCSLTWSAIAPIDRSRQLQVLAAEQAVTREVPDCVVTKKKMLALAKVSRVVLAAVCARGSPHRTISLFPGNVLVLSSTAGSRQRGRLPVDTVVLDSTGTLLFVATRGRDR